ncbi:MAG: hypothetical protein AAGA73_19005 [Pseudomonadota bacterium]
MLLARCLGPILAFDDTSWRKERGCVIGGDGKYAAVDENTPLGIRSGSYLRRSTREQHTARSHGHRALSASNAYGVLAAGDGGAILKQCAR